MVSLGLGHSIYPQAIRVKMRTVPPTFTYLPYDIRPHGDLLDHNGNPLLCLGAKGCHRYMEAAYPRLKIAVDAGAGSQRSLLVPCRCHLIDTNPPTEGRGGPAAIRRGGRGKGGKEEDFYARRNASPECGFFQKGACIHARRGGQMQQRTRGGPQHHPVQPPSPWP